MITKVAAQMGQSVRAQAEESYAITFWTYLQLEDQRRIATILARLERLDLATLVAFAFHSPRELDRIQKEELRAIGGAEDPESLVTKERSLVEMLRAKAGALREKMRPHASA